MDDENFNVIVDECTDELSTEKDDELKNEIKTTNIIIPKEEIITIVNAQELNKKFYDKVQLKKILIEKKFPILDEWILAHKIENKKFVMGVIDKNKIGKEILTADYKIIAFISQQEISKKDIFTVAWPWNVKNLIEKSGIANYEELKKNVQKLSDDFINKNPKMPAFDEGIITSSPALINYILSYLMEQKLFDVLCKDQSDKILILYGLTNIEFVSDELLLKIQ